MKFTEVLAFVFAASSPLVSAAPSETGDLKETTFGLGARSFEAPGFIEARSPTNKKGGAAGAAGAKAAKAAVGNPKKGEKGAKKGAKKVGPKKVGPKKVGPKRNN